MDQFLNISFYYRSLVKKAKSRIKQKWVASYFRNVKKEYKLSLAIRHVSESPVSDIWDFENYKLAEPQISDIPDLFNSKEICSNSKRFCQEKVKESAWTFEDLGCESHSVRTLDHEVQPTMNDLVNYREMKLIFQVLTLPSSRAYEATAWVLWLFATTLRTSHIIEYLHILPSCVHKLGNQVNCSRFSTQMDFFSTESC